MYPKSEKLKRAKELFKAEEEMDRIVKSAQPALNTVKKRNGQAKLDRNVPIVESTRPFVLTDGMQSRYVDLMQSVEGCVQCNNKSFFCHQCKVFVKEYYSRYTMAELLHHKTCDAGHLDTVGDGVLPEPNGAVLKEFDRLVNRREQASLGSWRLTRRKLQLEFENRLHEFDAVPATPCHQVGQDSHCDVFTSHG